MGLYKFGKGVRALLFYGVGLGYKEDREGKVIKLFISTCRPSVIAW